MSQKGKLLDIGIIVFDEVDLLDVTGPREVFSAVKSKIDTDNPDPILQLYSAKQVINIEYISISTTTLITTSDQTRIVPDTSLDKISVDNYDVIVIPGGKGVHFVKDNHALLKFIRDAFQQVTILSVCTGAYVIAEADILGEQPITTHFRHNEIFQKTYPKLNFVENVSFVESEKLIITGGVSAGIDGALRVLELELSLDIATDAAKTLNYSRSKQ